MQAGKPRLPEEQRRMDEPEKEYRVEVTEDANIRFAKRDVCVSLNA